MTIFFETESLPLRPYVRVLTDYSSELKPHIPFDIERKELDKMRATLPILLIIAGSATTGVSDIDVREKLSFDKNRPQDKVKITNRVVGSGRGSY